MIYITYAINQTYNTAQFLVKKFVQENLSQLLGLALDGWFEVSNIEFKHNAARQHNGHQHIADPLNPHRVNRDTLHDSLVAWRRRAQHFKGENKVAFFEGAGSLETELLSYSNRTHDLPQGSNSIEVIQRGNVQNEKELLNFPSLTQGALPHFGSRTQSDVGRSVFESKESGVKNQGIRAKRLESLARRMEGRATGSEVEYPRGKQLGFFASKVDHWNLEIWYTGKNEPFFVDEFGVLKGGNLARIPKGSKIPSLEELLHIKEHKILNLLLNEDRYGRSRQTGRRPPSTSSYSKSTERLLANRQVQTSADPPSGSQEATPTAPSSLYLPVVYDGGSISVDYKNNLVFTNNLFEGSRYYKALMLVPIFLSPRKLDNKSKILMIFFNFDENSKNLWGEKEIRAWMTVLRKPGLRLTWTNLIKLFYMNYKIRIHPLLGINLQQLMKYYYININELDKDFVTLFPVADRHRFRHHATTTPEGSGDRLERSQAGKAPKNLTDRGQPDRSQNERVQDNGATDDRAGQRSLKSRVPKEEQLFSSIQLPRSSTSSVSATDSDIPRPEEYTPASSPFTTYTKMSSDFSSSLSFPSEHAEAGSRDEPDFGDLGHEHHHGSDLDTSTSSSLGPGVFKRDHTLETNIVDADEISKRLAADLNARKLMVIYTYSTAHHRDARVEQLIKSPSAFALKILESHYRILSPIFGEDILFQKSWGRRFPERDEEAMGDVNYLVTGELSGTAPQKRPSTSPSATMPKDAKLNTGRQVRFRESDPDVPWKPPYTQTFNRHLMVTCLYQSSALMKAFRTLQAELFSYEHVNSVVTHFFDSIYLDRIAVCTATVLATGHNSIRSRGTLSQKAVGMIARGDRPDNPPATGQQARMRLNELQLRAETEYDEQLRNARFRSPESANKLAVALLAEVLIGIKVLKPDVRGDSSKPTRSGDLAVSPSEARMLSLVLDEHFGRNRGEYELKGRDIFMVAEKMLASSLWHESFQLILCLLALDIDGEIMPVARPDGDEMVSGGSTETSASIRARNERSIDYVFSSLGHGGFLPLDLVDEAILLMTDSRINFTQVCVCLATNQMDYRPFGLSIEDALGKLAAGFAQADACGPDIKFRLNCTISQNVFDVDEHDWMYVKEVLMQSEIPQERFAKARSTSFGDLRSLGTAKSALRHKDQRISPLRVKEDSKSVEELEITKFEDERPPRVPTLVRRPSATLDHPSIRILSPLFFTKGLKDLFDKAAATSDGFLAKSQVVQFVLTVVKEEFCPKYSDLPHPKPLTFNDVEDAEIVSLCTCAMLHQVLHNLHLSPSPACTVLFWLALCKDIAHGSLSLKLPVASVCDALPFIITQPYVSPEEPLHWTAKGVQPCHHRGLINLLAFRVFLMDSQVALPAKAVEKIFKSLPHGELNLTPMLYSRRHADRSITVSVNSRRNRYKWITVATLYYHVPFLLFTGMWPDALSNLIALTTQTRLPDALVDEAIATVVSQSNPYGLVRHADVASIMTALSGMGMSFAMLEECVGKMKLAVPPTLVRRMFGLMDINHDKTLSIGELLQGFEVLFNHFIPPLIVETVGVSEESKLKAIVRSLTWLTTTFVFVALSFSSFTCGNTGASGTAMQSLLAIVGAVTLQTSNRQDEATVVAGITQRMESILGEGLVKRIHDLKATEALIHAAEAEQQVSARRRRQALARKHAAQLPTHL